MAWYLKHRPRRISELHLSEVRQTLQQFMKDGRFPQVLLFAGPKGTGKTSAARIVGNLLNDPKNAPLVEHVFFGKKKPKQTAFQEPDTETAFAERVYAGRSFVVQEMDAASYRGIDDVRALKERVMLPPQEGKMAVYILDEAHMLTTEAFNALLKLLEEPPAHAVFILATTELHKIPATIISRSAKIDFRKATDEELVSALSGVADKEKITYEEEALLQLAQQADGSFRDGVKLLELAAQSGKLSLETIAAVVGQDVTQLIKDLVSAVVGKESTTVTRLMNELRSKNIQENYFYRQLLARLHQALMQDMGVTEGEPLVSAKVARFLLQELMKGDLQQVSPIPFLPLELKLLELIERAQANHRSPAGAPPSPAKKKIESAAAPLKQAQPEIKQTIEPVITETLATEVLADQDLQQLGQALLTQWEKFLQLIEQRNSTLAALLRSGKPALTQDGIPQVGVYYKFHQEQLQQRKYMALIQDCAKDVVGATLPLRIALQQTPVGANLVEVVEPTANLTELAEEALL